MASVHQGQVYRPTISKMYARNSRRVKGLLGFGTLVHGTPAKSRARMVRNILLAGPATLHVSSISTTSTMCTIVEVKAENRASNRGTDPGTPSFLSSGHVYLPAPGRRSPGCQEPFALGQVLGSRHPGPTCPHHRPRLWSLSHTRVVNCGHSTHTCAGVHHVTPRNVACYCVGPIR